MSKIDELINKLCPQGVKFKKLDDVVNFRRGSFPQPYGNENWYGGKGSLPFVQVADISDYGFKLNTYTKQAISKIAQKFSVFVQKDTVLVSLQGTIGRVAITQYDCFVDRTIGIFFNYKIEINKKYFAYQLKAKFDKEKLIARGSTLKTITKEEFSQFKIPIPPLEVQEEIVRILDNFTKLTAKLTAELTARKQQYIYYRNFLFNFSKKNIYYNLMKIEDICLKISSGGTPNTSNQEYYKGSIPWLRTQEVDFKDITETELYISEKAIKESSANLIEENCVIVAMYGATAGKVAINKIKLSTNQACCNLQVDKNKVLYKYVFYWLSSQYEVLKAKGQGSQSNINAKIVREFQIPIPSLEVQQRIVDILDKFDKLVNDISEGLPAEIAARQKQYEYYRDKLLTFKEVGNESI